MRSHPSQDVSQSDARQIDSRMRLLFGKHNKKKIKGYDSGIT